VPLRLAISVIGGSGFSVERFFFDSGTFLGINLPTRQQKSFQKDFFRKSFLKAYRKPTILGKDFWKGGCPQIKIKNKKKADH
jgi:hypothetical protein